jgi:putative hydrolase of the HAD superfamily
MIEHKKWIIFDADNTLWDLESLYNDARGKFCEYALNAINHAGLNAKGHVTLQALETAQRHRDMQLMGTHGYSASRFARSFEDTLLFFLQYATPNDVRHVRYIAEQVFEQTARPVENLESLLSRLKSKYSLAIITAGEKWVQERRLEQFNLREYFESELIVEKKTADIFAGFCTKNAIRPNHCWVVGDSVKSDISPAREAGLNAIHVKADNWEAEHAELPEGVNSVSKIEQIVDILL